MDNITLFGTPIFLIGDPKFKEQAALFIASVPPEERIALLPAEVVQTDFTLLKSAFVSYYNTGELKLKYTDDTTTIEFSESESATLLEMILSSNKVAALKKDNDINTDFIGLKTTDYIDLRFTPISQLEKDIRHLCHGIGNGEAIEFTNKHEVINAFTSEYLINQSVVIRSRFSSDPFAANVIDRIPQKFAATTEKDSAATTFRAIREMLKGEVKVHMDPVSFSSNTKKIQLHEIPKRKQESLPILSQLVTKYFSKESTDPINTRRISGANIHSKFKKDVTYESKSIRLSIFNVQDFLTNVNILDGYELYERFN
jgi:hypothetical protein